MDVENHVKFTRCHSSSSCAACGDNRTRWQTRINWKAEVGSPMLKSKRNSISTSLRQGCYAAEAEVASCPATARMLCRRRSVSLSHSLSSFADAARLSANAFHIEIGRQVGLLVHWVNADSCAAMFVYVRRMCVWARVCELFAAFGLPVLWITFWCELLFFWVVWVFFFGFPALTWLSNLFAGRCILFNCTVPAVAL